MTPGPTDQLVIPPKGEGTVIVLSDRRTERRWSVEVAPFQLGRVPVTNDLYRPSAADSGSANGRDLPVTDVSWLEAVRFCNRLSRLHGLAPAYDVQPVDVEPPKGWVPHHRPAPDDLKVTWDQSADGYRLPAEAEWELACRAGSAKARYGPLDDIAWYRNNSNEQPHPVAQKEPNEWGLFDMLGGVWEWCWDLYDEAVYGPYRVLRGGGWFDEHWSCRAGVRRRSHPTLRIDDVGFRLARSINS